MEDDASNKLRRLFGFLCPALIAVLLFAYRYPHYEFLDRFEASHYLGALQRVLDGQVLGRDFYFMFGPSVISLLQGWMSVFGFDLGSFVWFFTAGWYLYLFLLGVLVYQANGNIVVSAGVMVAFSLLAMPASYAVLNAWGGPRYVPPLLTLALLNSTILQAESKVQQLTIFALGCSVAMGMGVAPEQMILLLFSIVVAWGACYATRRQRILVLDRVGVLVLVLGFVVGGLFLPRWDLLSLVILLRNLSASATWWHPLGTMTGHICLIGMGCFVPLYGVARVLGCSRISPIEDPPRNVLVTLVVCSFFVCSFLYSFRAIAGPQLILGVGSLLLAIAALVPFVPRDRDSRFFAVLLSCGIFSILFVLWHSKAENPLTLFVSRLRANIIGQPLTCVDLCRRSIEPRLQGVMLPIEVVAELETLVRFMNEPNRRAVTYRVYPEDAYLEFLVGRSGVGYFPIANLADTMPAWRARFEEEMLREPPELLIWARRPATLAWLRGAVSLFPETERFIRLNYIEVLGLPNYVVLKHKSLDRPT